MDLHLVRIMMGRLTLISILHYRMASNAISTGEHIGTHLDAPYHTAKNGKYIGQITYEELHGPAVVIDITERAKADGNAVVTEQDLIDWENKNGRIPNRAWILMNSGWYKYWGDQWKYIGKYNKMNDA